MAETAAPINVQILVLNVGGERKEVPDVPTEIIEAGQEVLQNHLIERGYQLPSDPVLTTTESGKPMIHERPSFG